MTWSEAEPTAFEAERRLADGWSIPQIGLGTAPMDEAASEEAVVDALRIGYRLIDTGAAYGNEAGVGRGLARSGVPRGDVRVMTKLRGRDHGYEATLAAFDASRRLLGVEYVDFYLIHWPLPRVDRYLDSWRAMIRLRDEGLIRSIGVSNFTIAQIERLQAETGVLPAVDQIEVHPRYPQTALRAALGSLGVRAVCYSPLGRGGLLADPTLAAIAAAHGVSTAQVVLRWHVQSGSTPLPRASGSARRRENYDIARFELTPAEIDLIEALPQERTGFDPETHEEF